MKNQTTDVNEICRTLKIQPRTMATLCRLASYEIESCSRPGRETKLSEQTAKAIAGILDRASETLAAFSGESD